MFKISVLTLIAAWAAAPAFAADDASGARPSSRRPPDRCPRERGSGAAPASPRRQAPLERRGRHREIPGQGREILPSVARCRAEVHLSPVGRRRLPRVHCRRPSRDDGKAASPRCSSLKSRGRRYRRPGRRGRQDRRERSRQRLRLPRPTTRWLPATIIWAIASAWTTTGTRSRTAAARSGRRPIKTSTDPRPRSPEPCSLRRPPPPQKASLRDTQRAQIYERLADAIPDDGQRAIRFRRGSLER